MSRMHKKLFKDLFEEQVSIVPNNIAVIFNNEHLTYKELNEKSNQLARYIKKQYLAVTGKEIIPDVLVGICVERGFDMLIGILGVFKTEAAYVPIDMEYPEERVTFIIKDANINVILVQKQTLHKFPFLRNLKRVAVICLDDNPSLFAEEAKDNLLTYGAVEQLAYVIYTSGSTGAPKGAMIEQKGMVNHLFAKIEDLKLTCKDIVVQNASQCFDISVWQHLAVLLVGGSVVIFNNDIAHDPIKLIHYSSHYNVTILEIVPSMLRMILESGFFSSFDNSVKLEHMRWLILTGEALSPELCKQWYKLCANIPILNAYGPTECSDDVTHYVVPNPVDEKIVNMPIGRAIINMRIYLLDDKLKPVLRGEVGELYVSGVGVGRGYLNLEELTNAHFISNPFSHNNQDKVLYRTKDLAKWLPDGNLVYIGRVDDQVKIRGFRIELGEIESVLSKHRNVKQSVVIANQDNDEKRLVAYYVSKNGKKIQKLRDYLDIRLPKYMVPSVFVRLDQIPLTSNGKVDKKNLPVLFQESLIDNNYIAPRNDVEKALTKIWQEVFRIGRIGIEDNFYNLGGDSIIAIQIVSRAREGKIFLTLKQLFELQTIKYLAEAANRVSYGSEITQKDDWNSSYFSVGFEKTTKTYALSPLQMGLLFHAIYAPHSEQYCTQLIWDYNSTLNPVLLKEIWEDLVSTYEVFRTSFQWENLDEPVQIVHDYITIPWYEEDWSGLAKYNDDYYAKLNNYINNDRNKGFDITKAGLFRLHLLKLPSNSYKFIWTVHHMILDGWSILLLLNEITARYLCILRNKKHTFITPPPYVTYINWLKSQNKQEAQNFWKNLLYGIEGPNAISISKKAFDIHKPMDLVKEQVIYLPSKLVDKYSHFAKKHCTTINTLLQAAWALVLSKYSNQQDVTWGTAVSGRPADLTQVEYMIGLFINTIPLRLKLHPAMNALEFIKQIQECLQACNHYSYLPLNDIQAQSGLPNTVPLFYSLIIFENYPVHSSKSNSNNEDFTIDNFSVIERTNYPLVLFITPGDQLSIKAIYDGTCFAEEDVVRMLEHMQNALNWLVQAETKSLLEAKIINKQEEQQILFDWNNNAASYPNNKTIHELFEEQVIRTPNNIAIIFQDQLLTYRELNEKANQLAHCLRTRYREITGLKLTADALIGICLERGVEMVMSMLAVLKAGGAYVPIGVQYPKERIDYILNDTKISIVLTQKKYQHNFFNALCLDDEWSERVTYKSIDHGVQQSAKNLMYVLYTSGSTGQPKGVMIEHHSVVNVLLALKNVAKLNCYDRFLALTPVTFDIAAFEIYLPLLIGAVCVIAPEMLSLDGRLLKQYVEKQKISFIQATPTTWKILKQSGWRPVIKGFCGGEVLDKELVEYFSGASIWNVYGPTETTIWSSVYSCKQHLDRTALMPIGKPLQNTYMYVLDHSLNPTPVGIIGELYIGGVGVARGYLNRPDLNIEKFIYSPFHPGKNRSQKKKIKLYRTGDLVRWLSDGNLEFIERIDHQIKIRGFRIELGEIEYVLSKCPGVQQCVVIVKEKMGQKKVAAYYVSYRDKNHKSKITIDRLREYLAKYLPDYMIPTSFSELELLPLTSTGKINRKLLSEIEDENGLNVGTEYVKPLTDIESKLVQIWQDVLNRKKIGIRDNFFSLGGDSIVSIYVISKANSLGLNVSVQQLFAYPTIEKLAKDIIDKERARGIANDSFNVDFDQDVTIRIITEKSEEKVLDNNYIEEF